MQNHHWGKSLSPTPISHPVPLQDGQNYVQPAAKHRGAHPQGYVFCVIACNQSYLLQEKILHVPQNPWKKIVTHDLCTCWCACACWCPCRYSWRRCPCLVQPKHDARNECHQGMASRSPGSYLLLSARASDLFSSDTWDMASGSGRICCGALTVMTSLLQ